MIPFMLLSILNLYMAFLTIFKQLINIEGFIF
jgi:hypothetical protein